MLSLRAASKEWPNAALLAELAFVQFLNKIYLIPEHIKREQNTWADQLAAGLFEGFSPSHRVRPAINDASTWMLLPKLLTLHKASQSSGQAKPEARRKKGL